jgi:DNA polymerase-3 subunit alpha
VQQFVHLHNHTDFSIQDGLQRLKVMCELAAADSQSAIAITDHGTLGGAWSLARECNEVGIKPIIGVEAYLRLDDKQDEITIGNRKTRYYHITLIAQNNVGYKNLLQMQSIAWQNKV